jgi:hypothetical protein
MSSLLPMSFAYLNDQSYKKNQTLFPAGTLVVEN